MSIAGCERKHGQAAAEGHAAELSSTTPCPAVLRAAVQVSLLVEEGDTRVGCDATVLAVDTAGSALRVMRDPPGGCTYSVYGGTPPAVTVTATRDAFVSTSKTVALEKDRCGAKLAAFSLTLKRAAAAERR